MVVRQETVNDYLALLLLHGIVTKVLHGRCIQEIASDYHKVKTQLSVFVDASCVIY